MGMFAAFVGVGIYAGAVAIALINCIYLSYLLSVYATCHGRPVGMWSTSIRNHFGAPTTIAGFLLFWAGLSLLWTPRPAPASAYYLYNLVVVLISYMLCKLYPIRDVFLMACKGTAYAATASMPLAVVLIGFTGGRLGGVLGNSMVGPISSAGILGAICVRYLVLEKSMSKKLAIVFFVVYMSSLLLTFNKTGIIAFTLAALVYAMLAPGSFRRHIMRIIITALGVTITFFAAFSKIAEYANKSGAGSARTLSGRTIIWEATYRQIINGPYIRGYGEAAFREIGPKLGSSLVHYVHPHNEFLAIWFNFGLVGVVLVYLCYLALALISLKAFRCGGGHLAILILCTVILYFIFGITAASYSMCLFPLPWLLLYDCLISTRFETPKTFSFRDQCKIITSNQK